MKKLFFYSLLTLSLASYAQNTSLKLKQAKKRRLSLTKLTLAMDGLVVDSLNNQVRKSGLTLSLIAKYKLTPHLYLLASPSALFEYGTHEASFTDEFNPNQQLFLQQAYIGWTPLSFFKLKMGALNQDFFLSPLFIDSVAFLSAQEKLFYKTKNFEIFFKLQQAIPNNQVLTNKIGTVQRGTPKFLSESLGINFKNDLFLGKLLVSSFGFEKLSSSVAHQSRFLGNSVSGLGELNARLENNFRGYQMAMTAEIPFMKDYSLKLFASYHANSESADNNIGQLLAAELKMLDWQFSAQHFKNESDSSIAFYNSKYYGHNNRNGYRLEFGGNFKNPNWSFRFNFTDAQLINPNIYQNDATIIGLTFTKDVSL